MMIKPSTKPIRQKTTRDHEDDGIMETERDFEEESLFEDIVCYIFIFDHWCVMIYVSFIEFNLGYYVLGEVLGSV